MLIKKTPLPQTEAYKKELLDEANKRIHQTMTYGKSGVFIIEVNESGNLFVHGFNNKMPKFNK